MLITPALYLVDGKCMSPYKGDKENLTMLSADPLRSAREFEKHGATSILIIDGNFAGGQRNQKIAVSIAKSTKLKVIFADGIHSLDDIKGLLEGGISKVALGDGARDLLQQALVQFGADHICFLVRGERNFVEGKSDIDVVDYAKEIASLGARDIIFWDTKTEGTFHPNFDEVERLILGTGANITAFGGIGSMSDIEVLQNTGAVGVVLSRALFERKVSLSDCVRRFQGS